MYIIVVGGGEVGYHLSKILLNDGHDVLILEQNPARCDQLCDELGAVIYRGDGCEAATLDAIGTGRADMLIAVTDGDEDNLVACQVAKHKFNVPRTIARITNPKNETIFKLLGVDVTVCSTNRILAYIEQELPAHPVIPLLKLKGGSYEVIELKIPSESRVTGKKIKDFRLPAGNFVLLIIRKDIGPILPENDTILQAEDEIIVLAGSEYEDTIRSILMGK